MNQRVVKERVDNLTDREIQVAYCSYWHLVQLLTAMPMPVGYSLEPGKFVHYTDANREMVRHGFDAAIEAIQELLIGMCIMEMAEKRCVEYDSIEECSEAGDCHEGLDAMVGGSAHADGCDDSGCGAVPG